MQSASEQFGYAVASAIQAAKQAGSLGLLQTDGTAQLGSAGFTEQKLLTQNASLGFAVQNA